MSKRKSKGALKEYAYGQRFSKYKKRNPTTYSIVKRYSQSHAPSRMLSASAPCVLTYANLSTLNPGIGATNQVYRLSSIHDPDFTGVGHQPAGHDQLAGLYERYQVWKVDYVIGFANTDATNPGMVGVYIGDSSSTSNDAEEIIEQGQCQWGMLGKDTGVKTISGSVKLCDIHGVSYSQYMANDDYGGNFGANPVEEAYLKIFVDGLGVDIGAVKTFTQLVYHVKIMGGKLVNKS